jgi:hypothetical protein
MIKAERVRLLAFNNSELLLIIEAKIVDAAKLGYSSTCVELTSYTEAMNAQARLTVDGYSVHIDRLDDGLGTYYEMLISW